MTVLLGKTEVSLSIALERSAEILGASRKLLITGHGSDVAGIKAALRLAAQCGGVVDFSLDPDLLAQKLQLAHGGMVFTTPLEMRRRADIILILGATAGHSPAVAHVLNEQNASGSEAASARQIMWICPGEVSEGVQGVDIEFYQGTASQLPDILKALTASLDIAPAASTPIGEIGALTSDALEAITGRLVTAHYGVIVWSPKDFNAAGNAELVNIFAALNTHGRVTALPVAGNTGSQTAAEVCCWMTGYPSRFGFSGDDLRYDPVLYEAERFAGSGECDAILWLSSLETIGPLWKSDVPLIAISRHGIVFRHAPDVWIETAIPGIDVNTELYSEITQTILSMKAARSSALPSPAAVLNALCDQLATGAA